MVEPARCSLLPPRPRRHPLHRRSPPSRARAPPAEPVPGPVTGPVPTPTPTPSPTPASSTPGFAYYPPGELIEKDKGRGRAADRMVYAPNIIFPLKLGDGLFPHMNSQIWGYGGGGWNGKGAAGGSESDPRNYDPMKQRDNYCEVRGWDDAAVPVGRRPSGPGHPSADLQGQLLGGGRRHRRHHHQRHLEHDRAAQGRRTAPTTSICTCTRNRSP